MNEILEKNCSLLVTGDISLIIWGKIPSLINDVKQVPQSL